MALHFETEQLNDQMWENAKLPAYVDHSIATNKNVFITFKKEKVGEF